MGKRVYELAKIYGVPSKELVTLLHKLGFMVESHMSVLPEGAELALQKQRESSKRLSSDKKNGSKAEKPRENTPVKVTEKRYSSQQVPVAPPTLAHHGNREEAKPKGVTALICEPMTVGVFAERTGHSLGEIIAVLLRQGKPMGKNQLLSEELVASLMRIYSIPQEDNAKKLVTPSATAPLIKLAVDKATGVVRQPIVVVMGHVDHGKTTLLDTIRKTRVATREKGGITQHLGAYEVATPQGKITFLDTPGHAAFSMIRSRGARIADIAILVVAADDGPQPQTVEALKAAQAVDLPIIVAINKVDRASVAQIESVKKDLTQWGLVAEDWGGTTIMVPISAKTGQGVTSLLEMVLLQAQMMELNAAVDAPAHGFVIEASMRRGLGPVATVIVREGTLRIGDMVAVGAMQGRITALIDAYGSRVRQATPAMPVLVAGFDALPQAGDELAILVGPQARKVVREKEQMVSELARSVLASHERQADAIYLVLKADTASSLEALLGALQKMKSTLGRPIHIIQQGVGPVSEGDITTARNMGAIIYGLHVKWEPRSQEYAHREQVTVKLFGIIYKLLDDITLIAQKQRSVEKSLKKIGEAVVLKVFEIKKMGTVAGSLVKSGIFSRDGVVKVFRGKNRLLVGEGRIESLQRDRKAVKEVHSGFECAFLVHGFSDWQEDDRVECFALMA